MTSHVPIRLPRIPEPSDHPPFTMPNDKKPEPQIEPHKNSSYWVTTKSAVITDDVETTLLVVRFGLAFNAMLAQHRFALTALNANGADVSRDSVAAFTVAAALTEESRLVINGDYKRIMALARRGGAPESLIKQFGHLNSRKGPLLAALDIIRNKLTFHWDADEVAKSLADFVEYDSVIWLEGRDETLGQTVCRLSADVLLNAVYPEPAEYKVLPPEERQNSLQLRTREQMGILLDGMMTMLSLLNYAISGYLVSDSAQARGNRK